MQPQSAISAADAACGPGRVSLVVPTRQEAPNIRPLLDALAPLLGRVVHEVVFVDDSDDDTPGEITAAAPTASVPVRCVHRERNERVGGLSGAVVEGIRAAAHPVVAVMDADLQHPPSVLADLAAAIASGADLAYGTRFGPEGSADGLSGAARQLVSRASSSLARLLFPRRLGTVSDPMSGLFIVRRNRLDLAALRPTGFKILLELLVRHDLATKGVPFSFGDRHAGDSKASVREGIAYVRHLVRLRTSVGRASRAIGFAAVGASGLLVNHLALFLSVERLALAYTVGAVLATQASTLWNFVLNDRIVFAGARPGSSASRFARFWCINNALLLLRVPVLAVLVSGLGIQYLIANQLTFVALYAVRFAFSDRLVWGEQPPGETLMSSRRHTYDVAGIVTISSQVELRELALFEAEVPDGAADIEVTRGVVGSRRPGKPAVRIAAGEVTYSEHLGGLCSNFSVDMGSPIRVKVSPLLAASPHVVYTNIIEALMRFLLVSRDHMLLHSAAFELDGHGVMLSARTDTGKTGTILRLIRERGAVFLSDDMTIIRPDGSAHTFPKPLTISAHTLAAVAASPLGRLERWKLAIQSRLHSKQGRSIGAWLAEHDLPIMSFNALVQKLVPPPKYHVDRLVPTIFGSEMRVEDVFIIERGPDGIEDVEDAGALQELIENTDDAYGFPPFAQFAPAIAIEGDGYLTLRAKESAILARFLETVRVRRVRSDCFGWADVIPTLTTPKVIDLRLGPATPEPSRAEQPWIRSVDASAR